MPESHPHRGRSSALTPKQREVLQAVAAGEVKWHFPMHGPAEYRIGYTKVTQQIKALRARGLITHTPRPMGTWHPIVVELTDAGRDVTRA